MVPWSFVVIADPQPGSPRSYRFNPQFLENWETARAQIMALQPELVLIPGDITRDGSLHDFEFAEMKASLDGMGIPYHAIPGNMDTGNKHTDRRGPGRDDRELNVTAETLDRYCAYFGEMPWTFVHKDVRFSGFYSALAGSGLAREDAMWAWLEGLAALPKARHHVMLTHYALFIESLDEPNFDITDPAQYTAWYFGIDQPHRQRIFAAYRAAGVDLVFSGHIHCRRPAQTVGGIRFFKCAATCFPQWGDRWPDGDPTLGFHRLEVSDDGIAEEFVPLARVSRATGAYGPGGHPPPEARDYSQAWVKDGVALK